MTLTNAIESPVRVRELAAAIEYGDSTGDAEVVEVTPALPADLQPGGTLELVVRPIPAASGRITGVRIDQTEVDVRPDKEKIWDAILDDSVEPSYDRPITVVATYVFQAQAEATDPIQAVVVDFDRGNAIELTAAEPEGEGKVAVPVADIILRNEQESSYRYRLQVARRSGSVARDTDSREDDIDRLLLSVDELPRSSAAREEESGGAGEEEDAGRPKRKRVAPRREPLVIASPPDWQRLERADGVVLLGPYIDGGPYYALPEALELAATTRGAPSFRSSSSAAPARHFPPPLMASSSSRSP